MTRKIKKVGNFSPTGHYGKNVYDAEGLCPTLCSGSIVKNGLNILIGGGNLPNRKVKRLGTTNGHQSGNVYNSEGLSLALCCTDYKAPVKILEEKETEMDLEKNFTKVGEGKYVTTERERVVMQLPLAHAVDH